MAELNDNSVNLRLQCDEEWKTSRRKECGIEWGSSGVCRGAQG